MQHQKPSIPNKKPGAPQAPLNTGYVPPDVAYASTSSTEKSKGFNMNVKVTSDDIPFHIKLGSTSEGLRKRKDRVDINQDPNNFDYDIEDLIKEDEEDEKEQLDRAQRAYYKEEKLGNTNEELV